MTHFSPRRITAPYTAINRSCGSRLSLLLAITLLAAVQLPAQQQSRNFEIGISGVYGNVDFPVPNNKWADWIADTVATGSTRGDAIPSNRWEQLRELGVTMAHLNIAEKAVVVGPDNVAAKLNRAAWLRGLSLSIGDPYVRRISNTERRIFHMESDYDFDYRGGGELVMERGFSTLRPRHDIHDLDSLRHFNALRFRSGPDAGSVISGFRQGGYFFAQQLGDDRISGRYVLSLRCMFDAPSLQMANDTVLTVRLSGTAAGATFALTIDALREALREGRAPHEIVLGRLIHEEVQTGSGVRSVAGTIPTVGGNVPSRTDSDLLVELRYHGVHDITIDALIFSDEIAFALFQPNHPEAASAYRGERAKLEKRLRLLGADSTNPYPALQILEMREMRSTRGGYPVVHLIGSLLENMAGTKRAPVRPHTYTNAPSKGYGERLRMDGAGMRGVLSGQYVYLYEERFGVHAEDPAYYDSLYFPAEWSAGGRNTWLNGQSFSTWQRYFALSRKAVGVREWFPPIQNHSWLLRSGWPNSPQTDSDWLYEPTAAELRMTANMALCYGATSLMLYMFSSWPGTASVPVIYDRDHPEYWDMGSIGLLDPHNHEPRTRATNAENKWDSTRTLISRDLKPLLTQLQEKTWEEGYNTHRHLTEGVRGKVRRAQSWIPGTFTADAGDRVFVEIGEYSDPDHPGDLFLVILNKRIDRRGARTIHLDLRERYSDVKILFPGNLEHESLDTVDPSYVLTLQPGHAALLQFSQ